MTAIIVSANVVGGHDGRAEIEVTIRYENGGVSAIALDEEACLTSLDKAGITSIDELAGQPWTVLLPALEEQQPNARNQNQEHLNGGALHARSHHS